MSQTDTIAGLGARTDHVALAPLVDPERLALTPEERVVLRGVGRVATIAEVVARSGMPESRAISILLSLRVKGAVVPARVAASPGGTPPPVDAALLEEVDLDPARKREIFELERNLDRLNHFEVLGIPVSATSAEVKKAYHEASRRFHPDRFFNKDLGSYRGRVERIFKRVSEANAVLSDEARRAAYVKANPELTAFEPSRPSSAAASAAPQDPAQAALAQAREAERRARLARHPYLLKNAKASDLLTTARQAIAKGEFAQAITQLEQAISLDARNLEAKGLLEDAKKKENQARAKREIEYGEQALVMSNLTKALDHFKGASRLDPDSAAAAARVGTMMLRIGMPPQDAKPFLQRAADLEPRNAQYRFLLGQVHLELGVKSVAKRLFEETLKLDPAHPEAKAQLKKFRWPF